MNIVVLQGRLTKDPEKRFTQNNVETASFTLAVDRQFKVNGEKVTDFVNCVAWKQTADFIAKYFSKGERMTVCGKLQSHTYTDKNGNNRTAWEVVVDTAELCEKKSTKDTNKAEFEPIPDDAELPF
jgi:single-strand DNA-binding protein